MDIIDTKNKKKTKKKVVKRSSPLDKLAESDITSILAILIDSVNNLNSIVFLLDIAEAFKVAKEAKEIDENGYFSYCGKDLTNMMNLSDRSRQYAIRHLSDVKLISRKRGPDSKYKIRINEGELNRTLSIGSRYGR